MDKTNRHKRRLVVFATAMALSLCAGAVFAQDIDIKILKKALRNALGEKTNAGTRRVVALRQEKKEGRKTLIIGVVANNSPTPAGLRHGILVDVAKILDILKDWDWPSKVDRALVGEYYAEKKGDELEARPVLICSVSSETIKRIDWAAIDPGKILEVVDEVEIDGMIK
jgi:hypothetical protein